MWSRAKRIKHHASRITRMGSRSFIIRKVREIEGMCAALGMVRFVCYRYISLTYAIKSQHGEISKRINIAEWFILICTVVEVFICIVLLT